MNWIHASINKHDRCVTRTLRSEQTEIIINIDIPCYTWKKIHPWASIEMLAYIKNLADTWCIFNLVPRWEMWLNPGIITNLLGLNGSRSKEYNFFVVQLLEFVVHNATVWHNATAMCFLISHPSDPQTSCTSPDSHISSLPSTNKKWLQKTWNNSKRTITIFLKMTKRFSIDWIRTGCSPFWRNSVVMEADGCGRDMKVTGS